MRPLQELGPEPRNDCFVELVMVSVCIVATEDVQRRVAVRAIHPDLRRGYVNHTARAVLQQGRETERKIVGPSHPVGVDRTYTWDASGGGGAETLHGVENRESARRNRL